MKHLVVYAIVALTLGRGALGEEPRVISKGGEATRQSYAEAISGLEAVPGLIPSYFDREKGRILFEFSTSGPESLLGEFLHVDGLTTGLGSNPLGLDRGRIGQTRLIRFRRLGEKVLIEQPNLSFRALTSNPEEERAVAEAFATSVLWGREFEALSEDGRLLVDVTSFLVRDGHDIVRQLKDRGQGEFRLDPERSALLLGSCLAFPDNLELEALVTFAGKEPGGFVRSTAPTGEAVSFRLHHSFVRLPEGGYQPRRFDPRGGSFSVGFADYAVRLADPLETNWIVRFRLEKTRPGEARSPVKKPIVFYVDRGVPEPVRQALIDGASWWATAFDAAGFIDAFEVKLLPPDVHPLDVRYNTIHWVHRSTRGWSYGGGVTDPRTGERIKGQVLLGSLRVRQDRLLFEGLAGVDKTGTGDPDDPIEIALQRIRQLSAHEVGHALGFNHNFIASTYGDRASVMDYPAPRVRVTEKGTLDFSSAYGVGVGVWDRFAVHYAYSIPPSGKSEEEYCAELIRGAIRENLSYITDADARPASASHPRANLWDNGAEPIEELRHILRVRKVALSSFGEQCIAEGRPVAMLQEVLAPVYFYHRYQVEAVAKVVGGMEFSYAVRGDGQGASSPVAPHLQREALELLLDCLAPQILDLPEDVLPLLLPRPSGSEVNREMFVGVTGAVFDGLGAAATGADLVLRFLLHPERCARVVDFHRRASELPSLEEILHRLTESVFGGELRSGATAREEEIRRAVQAVCLHRLMRLGLDSKAPPRVRSRVEAELSRLRQGFESRSAEPDPVERAHRAFMKSELDRYFSRGMREPSDRLGSSPLPPGSPIGTGTHHGGGGCSHDVVPDSKGRGTW